jgi:hypothetical protein
MGAGIRKAKVPATETRSPPESNIVEISPDDEEFYHKKSAASVSHEKKMKTGQREIKNDLQIIDFQDQELLSKKESFDDRQNSIRGPVAINSTTAVDGVQTSTSLKGVVIRTESPPLDHRVHPMEDITTPSPERKQSRQKILESFVLTSVDDLHCRSTDSNDGNDRREESRRKESHHSTSPGESRPSSSRKSSRALTPPHSASSKMRFSPHKDKSKGVLLSPSQSSSGLVESALPRSRRHSPVASHRTPAPSESHTKASVGHPQHQMDSSPIIAIPKDQSTSPRLRNKSFLTSVSPRELPHAETQLKSRQNSAETRERSSTGDPSPPTPFYNKSKHEAVFHQLQINELRHSLDESHVNSLLDPSPGSSPHLPQLISSFSTTPPDVSLISPSLRSDLDEEEAAALMGHGKIIQKVKKENKLLLELQRQRTISTMHNAKLELEVDSLRRQLEYLDQLEEEEEERAMRQEAKMSSRQDWEPSLSDLADEAEAKGGGVANPPKKGRPLVQQQSKPQLPPGIQIGSSSSQSNKMNSSTSSDGFSHHHHQQQQPSPSLQITSPRSDRIKKNSSAVVLSPRAVSHRMQPQPYPAAVSPRLSRQPSEGINVSPIRRVHGGPSHPANPLEVVAKPLSEAKQSQHRNNRQLPSQQPRARRPDPEDVPTGAEAENSFSNSSGEVKQMQKQASKSVLKNVNRR